MQKHTHDSQLLKSGCYTNTNLGEDPTKTNLGREAKRVCGCRIEAWPGVPGAHGEQGAGHDINNSILDMKQSVPQVFLSVFSGNRLMEKALTNQNDSIASSTGFMCCQAAK